MERHRSVIGTKGRIFAAVGVASLLLATIGADAAFAAATPEGLKAKFSGALKGKAKGGTSDALCVFTPRVLTAQDGALPPAIQQIIGVVTTHWDGFTVNGEPVSLSLEVGSPIAGDDPNADSYEVPWAAGAPRGSAELIVNIPGGEFVTTPDSKKPLVTTRESKAIINTTLKAGKQKLHVKATIDCLPGDATAPNPANPANP